jgi:transcription elongation GreA/GreB family factor
MPGNISLSMEEIGEKYYRKRLKIKKQYNIGLTPFYNEFHNVSSDIDGVIEIRELHREMDSSIMELYGWSDIDLRHDFYELDNLPENDRVRYTIHPDARKKVLKRLLLLNHERFEEEVLQGLHKKKDVVAYFEQKNQEIPERTIFSNGKKSTKKAPKKKEKALSTSTRTQQQLFEEPDLFNSPDMVSENCKVSVQKEDGKEFKYHVFSKAVKGDFTEEHKQISNSSKLAEVMLGRRVNDIFVFGGAKYKILEVK